MVGDRHNDVSEEWVSYRKLVIETLSKLDDRSLELFDRVSEVSGRVTNLEKAINEFPNIIEQDVAELREARKENTKRIETLERESASRSGMQKVGTWIVRGLWAIVTVVVGGAITYIVGNNH
jgi:predicted RNase H-like nuclease (RuvC/YqgF family)